MLPDPIRRLTLSLFAAVAALVLAPADHALAQPGGQDRSGPTAAPFRVMTFNIRYNNPGDSLDAWPHRRQGVVALIRFHDPDLVGLQEAQQNQLADFDRLLPGYAGFGAARNDGGPRDEYSSILYRTERFELLAQGTFWLSETPNVPASRGWDANLPRIATWGRFRDRTTGDTILHLNTHFDHMGVRARAESARLLKRWLAASSGGLPVVVTGDLNAPPSSEPISILADHSTAPRLHDAFTVSEEAPYGPTSTWNGFKTIEPGRRIDFIFVGDGIRVLEHAILSETLENGRFPSDHLPVVAELVVARP